MATTKTAKRVVRKRRERKNIEKGAVHIRSSFNNTMVTVTDTSGNAISWASSGDWASAVPEINAVRRPDRCRDRGKSAMEHGLKSVEVFVKGPGPTGGRDPRASGGRPGGHADQGCHSYSA
jgi:small subunit ribosomal protein S11